MKLPEVRHINLKYVIEKRPHRLQFSWKEKICADLHVSLLLKGNTKALCDNSAQNNTCSKIRKGGCEEMKTMSVSSCYIMSTWK